MTTASALRIKPTIVSNPPAHNGVQRSDKPAKQLDATYQYNKDMPGFKDVSMSVWVPPSEYFSSTYVVERLQHSIQLIYSMITNDALFFQRSKATEHGSLEEYEQYFPPFYIIILPFLRIPLQWFLPADKFVSKPKLAEGKAWQSDKVFAEQRLSGMNPFMLRVLTKDDKRVSVLRSASPVVTDTKVTQLLESGAS